MYLIPYLYVIRYIPFDKDNLEHGKDHHQVSRVLFSTDKIDNTNDGVTTHVLERFSSQLELLRLIGSVLPWR